MSRAFIGKLRSLLYEFVEGKQWSKCEEKTFNESGRLAVEINRIRPPVVPASRQIHLQAITSTKKTPCLVPYRDLPDSEKFFDRATAMETLEAIIKLGFSISRSCP